MGCDLLWKVDYYSANETTYSEEEYAALELGPLGEDNTTSLKKTYEMVSHYIYHILLPIVLSFGVFGNVLNLTVFTRRRIREGMSEIEKAATTGLMFLAVADLLFCVAGLVGHLLRPFASVYADSPVTTVAFYFDVYDQAIFNCLLFISTWLVVAVSVERYIAVTYPFQARQFVRVRRTVILNLAVYVLSFVFNIPHFLEWQIEESECVKDCMCYIRRLGPYGSSDVFRKVYTMLWSVIGTFLPLGILVMCNIQFLVEIYRSRRTFGLTVGGSNGPPHQRLTRITAILIAIIFMFLLLVCPSMLIGFLDTRLGVSDHWSEESYYRFRLAEVIFNLTQTINFSVNFLLYCSLSREFRRTLNAMVCRWKNGMTSLASSPSKLRRSKSDVEDTHVLAGRRRSAAGSASPGGGSSMNGSIVKKVAVWKESISSINKSNGVTYV